MQATITTKHVGIGLSRIKLAAGSLAIIGSLALGTTAISLTTDDDAQPIGTRAASVAWSQTTNNARFMEMNALPDTRVSTSTRDRADVIGTMRTIDGAVQPPTVSFQSVRLHEMNMLPDVAASVVTNQRLFEMNILPGDAARLVPPASDRRGTPY